MTATDKEISAEREYGRTNTEEGMVRMATLLADSLWKGQDVAAVSTADANAVNGLIQDGVVKNDITAEQMLKLQNCMRHGKGAIGANQAIIGNFIAQVELEYNHQLRRDMTVKLVTLDLTAGLDVLLLGLLRRVVAKDKLTFSHLLVMASKLQLFSGVTNIHFFDNAIGLVLEIAKALEKGLIEGAVVNMGDIFSEVFVKSIGKSVNDIRKAINKGTMTFESVGGISPNAQIDLLAAIAYANGSTMRVGSKRAREETAGGKGTGGAADTDADTAKATKSKPCFAFKHGTCTRGTACHFGHFVEKCRLFSSGKCAKGDKCNFGHT